MRIFFRQSLCVVCLGVFQILISTLARKMHDLNNDVMRETEWKTNTKSWRKKNVAKKGSCIGNVKLKRIRFYKYRHRAYSEWFIFHIFPPLSCFKSLLSFFRIHSFQWNKTNNFLIKLRSKCIRRVIVFHKWHIRTHTSPLIHAKQYLELIIRKVFF